jgi:hypothetical protein
VKKLMVVLLVVLAACAISSQVFAERGGIVGTNGVSSSHRSTR